MDAQVTNISIWLHLKNKERLQISLSPDEYGKLVKMFEEAKKSPQRPIFGDFMEPVDMPIWRQGFKDMNGYSTQATFRKVDLRDVICITRQVTQTLEPSVAVDRWVNDWQKRVGASDLEKDEMEDKFYSGYLS